MVFSDKFLSTAQDFVRYSAKSYNFHQSRSFCLD